MYRYQLELISGKENNKPERRKIILEPIPIFRESSMKKRRHFNNGNRNHLT